MCSSLLNPSRNFVLICSPLKKSHDTVIENKQECVVEHPHAHSPVSPCNGDPAGLLEPDWDEGSQGRAAQHWDPRGPEGRLLPARQGGSTQATASTERQLEGMWAPTQRKHAPTENEECKSKPGTLLGTTHPYLQCRRSRV